MLSIARAERDTPAIRKYAYRFIEHRFDNGYYRIYKSAFPASEWTKEFERLLKHYATKSRGFNEYFSENSAANLLAEEKLSERLLSMLEEKPSPQAVEHYLKHFANTFPERTLALFKKAVDIYSAKNVGGHHYDDIAKWLGIIRKLPGGGPVFTAMLADYRETYRRRPSMMRILASAFGE